MTTLYSSLPDDEFRLLNRSLSPANSAIEPRQNDPEPPLPTIHGWPEEPQRLAKGWLMVALAAVVTVLAPIGFLSLAAIVASSNGKQPTKKEKYLLLDVLKIVRTSSRNLVHVFLLSLSSNPYSPLLFTP
jgi:hypothetical protein